MDLSTLTWSQPRPLRRWYELHRGGELIGELRFPGWFAARARATVGGAAWDVRSDGFYRSAVEVSRVGTPTVELTYTRDALRSGGLLAVRGQPPLRVRLGTFRRRVLIRTSRGDVVMRLRYWGLLRLRGTVELGARQAPPDGQLLAVMGWYLVVTGIFQFGVEYGMP